MSVRMDGDRFANSLLATIETEIRKIADEEAEAAAQRVRDRTRARVNEMAVSMMKYFSVERFGDDLRITVKHEERKA